MPPIQPIVPFYQNWTFWQWVVSLTALAIAVAPHIRRLWRGYKLDLEVWDQIRVIHTVGNPNVTAFIMLRNIGGKPVRVRGIELTFAPRDRPVFVLPGRSFYATRHENRQFLLAPFELNPGDEWSNSAYFFRPFNRAEDKHYRASVAALRANIVAKREAMGQPKDDVEGDPELVAPFHKFFDEHFQWLPGEYDITITANVDPAKASVSRKVRMTLFESDSEELRSYTKDFKFGLGTVIFDSAKHPSLEIPVTFSK